MQTDIALTAAGYLATYVVLVAAFALAFTRVLRQPRNPPSLPGQSRYARERLQSTRRGR